MGDRDVVEEGVLTQGGEVGVNSLDGADDSRLELVGGAGSEGRDRS